MEFYPLIRAKIEFHPFIRKERYPLNPVHKWWQSETIRFAHVGKDNSLILVYALGTGRT